MIIVENKKRGDFKICKKFLQNIINNIVYIISGIVILSISVFSLKQ